MVELLSMVEIAIQQSNQQQADLSVRIESWESAMARREKLMEAQQKDLSELLRALRATS